VADVHQEQTPSEVELQFTARPGGDERDHSSRLGRLDAGHRVLDDEALLRRHAQLLGPVRKMSGCGSPLREVAARDIGVQELQEGESRRHLLGLQIVLFRESVPADLAEEEPAFLEEEAAATWIPASLTAMMKRSVWGRR
jgi:hypothetical protein